MAGKCTGDAREAAHCAIDDALRIDPRNADAWAIRAELNTVYDWDWGGATADVRQGEALGGGEFTEFAAARLAYAVGQMPRARQVLDSILSRSPFDEALMDRDFFVESRAGDFSAADGLPSTRAPR